MKNLFHLLITLNMVVLSFAVGPMIHTFAATNDSNQPKDTLELLLKKHGADTEEDKSDSIDLRFQDTETDENHTILKVENKPTQKISKEELSLLARLVHAEAKGEPYKGKVAVATVVLNRVEHEQFPDTIEEVVYEENAFEPVSNDSIEKPADEESYKAVKDALAVKGKNEELLYFYNPETATSDWIRSREVVKTIGNHAFAI